MNLKTLKSLMEQKGISSIRVAEKLGMQRSVMTHIMHGRTHATDSPVDAGLEKIFSVPPGSLRNAIQLPKGLTAFTSDTAKALKLYALATLLGLSPRKQTSADWLFFDSLLTDAAKRYSLLKESQAVHSDVKPVEPVEAAV